MNLKYAIIISGGTEDLLSVTFDNGHGADMVISKDKPASLFVARLRNFAKTIESNSLLMKTSTEGKS